MLTMGLEAKTSVLPYYEIEHPEISRICVFPTPEETAQAAAGEIIGLVRANPHANITYATGDTVIPLYESLAKAAKEGRVDFSQTSGFHLDEYYPCGPDINEYPHGFVAYLRQRVFAPLGIKKANEMNGLASDPEAEAKRYDSLLSAQPIDIAILGIGPWSDEEQTGCHIAFNESGTPINQRVHVQILDPVTLMRDRQERGQNSPDRTLTQGIANILEARRIILLAYGEKKGQSLREALFGEIGSQRPASALRLKGHKVTLFIDEAAASQLKKKLIL